MTPSTYLYGGQVHANGIRQHYLRYGGTADNRASRAAVILIPGITSPAVTWGFVAEHLGRQFDTYVLDVRGRGLSASGPGLDYGLDAQAADVTAFAQALGLERYTLVGHSMGGRIAVRAASKQPQGLASLVIVDPPVSGPGRRAYPANLAWYVDSIRQATHGMTAEDMKAFCPPGPRPNASCARSGCIPAMSPPSCRALQTLAATTSTPTCPASPCRCC